MNKNVIYFFVIVMSFFMFNGKSLAVTNNNVPVNNKVQININNMNYLFTPAEESCDTLFGSTTNEKEPAYWMQKAFDVMKLLGIAALIVFSSLDFFKAMTQDDKDAIKKASTKSFKRLIYCIIIYFLPIIIEFLMRALDVYDSATCGIK